MLNTTRKKSHRDGSVSIRFSKEEHYDLMNLLVDGDDIPTSLLILLDVLLDEELYK